MEHTISWISPKSSTGSFLLAALAHGALFSAVLLSLNLGAWKPSSVLQSPPEEIAYETLSASPAPKPVIRQITQAPKPEPKEKPKEQKDETPDNTPKELQDKSSTITGTQSAAKSQPPVAAGTSTAGEWPSTPFYKIKPKYPRAALVSGTEGWIALRIDVNEKGEVENVRVVGGEQRSLFQDEARRAVEKWKYKPFADPTGKPVKVVDHEVRVDFKLNDAA